MTVVTISRHFGAGGHTLAEELCERFSFQLVDEQIINESARKAKVSPGWLTAMEKESSSTLLSTISSFVSSGLFYKQAGVGAEREERQKYIAFLTQTFTGMAKEGGYVIVGRGAQFILKGHPKAVHLLLVADNKSRIEFLVGHHKISRSEAVRKIRVKQRERTAVASRLFKSDIDDLDLYHMVLNTGLIPYECAVETACQLVNRFIERESKSSASHGGEEKSTPDP